MGCAFREIYEFLRKKQLSSFQDDCIFVSYDFAEKVNCNQKLCFFIFLFDGFFLSPLFFLGTPRLIGNGFGNILFGDYYEEVADGYAG